MAAVPRPRATRSLALVTRAAIFTVGDLEATFDQPVAWAADVLEEPTDQFGGRDCAFRDPSGNLVRIAEA